MKKKSTKLDTIRKKIDAVDSDLLKLLNRRTKLVLDIADTKKRAGTAFYVPKREKEIVRRLAANNKGPFPNKALKNVFREIMSASLSLEKPVKIAFLGPIATFTHQACIEHFGLSGEFIPKNNISDVFDDVEKGRAEFGVVPIENTAEGVVTHTLDMFVPSDLKVRAEIMIEVSLALLNRTGRKDDIRKVASHPHALAQCRNWLKEHLPDAALFSVSSTATAAKLASEDPSTAAVASSAAASLYNLRVLEDHVEDRSHNYTRFLVIGRHLVKRTGEDKTSLVFAIKDAPGALFKMLQPFAKRDINLTKIESRPMKTRTWEYIFFIDLEGHVNEKRIKEAVEELEKSCIFLKVLGSYPRSPIKASE